MRLRFLIAITISLLGAAPVHAERVISWTGEPIALELPVGVEQRLRFEGPAAVGIPAAIARDDVFRAEFVNDTAYWIAVAPFESQRIKVRLNGSGTFVLFDVSATLSDEALAAGEPLLVIVKNNGAQEESGPITAAVEPSRASRSGVLFDLIRYAAQAHYAPARVVTPAPGVRPLPSSALDTLSFDYAHDDAVRLELSARAAWTTGALQVTALETRNLSADVIELNPARLAGSQLVATAAIRKRLAPAGETDDTTVLFVVTAR